MADDDLVTELEKRIYLHAFAAFKVRGRMAPAVDRANRDTARRTAEKLVGFLTERYELRLKDAAGRRAGRPGPDGRRPVDDAEAAQHGRS